MSSAGFAYFVAGRYAIMRRAADVPHPRLPLQ